MNLSELLEGVDIVSVCQNVAVHDVTNDSRKVQPKDLYIAIRGAVSDGHKYARQALEQGASAVVVEEDLGLNNQVIVQDSRKAYAVICANLFGNPNRELRFVGVTGTNGKTSVTTMIKHILEYSGLKTGLIGTIQIEYGETVQATPNTTPDAYLLHKTLREMADAGCRYVVMEASSHALAQERLYGCTFEVCAFTNLTQDHLDYHQDMEDYFQAKKKLFSMCEKAVINICDPYGRRLAKELNHVIAFGINQKDSADFTAEEITCMPGGVSFRIRHNDVSSRVSFAIPGRYSVENAMTAACVCSALGISMNKIVTTLEQMKGVKGRCEIIYQDQLRTVICDYAHSPDGIENVLSSMKECCNGRIIALFGCGGDRDKTKRPKMAAACEKYADFIIVTSDNPRSEDPEAIIEDILPGLSPNAKYTVIPDRKQAIGYSLFHAQKGDVIMLLGKGHETYQVLKEGTIHFDEREIVADFMTSK